MVRYYKNDNRPFKWLWEMAAFMEKKRPSEEEDEDSVTAAVAEEDAKGWSDRRWRGRGGCGGGVTLEGFVLGAAGNGEGGKTRRSLTDEDLEELKGCLDLGFGFSYEEIPELRNTLPALELCYSMSQMLRLDDPNQQMSSENSPLLAHWRISSPGKLGPLVSFPVIPAIWRMDKDDSVLPRLIYLFGVLDIPHKLFKTLTL